MSRFNDYAADVAAGMQQGAADVGRSAVADIGNAYQDILLGNSAVRPNSGPMMTMENVTVQAEPETPAPALEADPAPPMPEREIDIE